MLDSMTPQQRQLLLIGAPLVGVAALFSLARRPKQTEAVGMLPPAPSTDAIGVGQLAAYESSMTQALLQMQETIESWDRPQTTTPTTPPAQAPAPSVTYYIAPPAPTPAPVQQPVTPFVPAYESWSVAVPEVNLGSAYSTAPPPGATTYYSLEQASAALGAGNVHWDNTSGRYW